MSQAIAMGANKNQTLKAIKEAEAYDGPSLILAYSPCAEHGIKGGLSNHQKTQAKAVECGYVDLYRYNPAAEKPLTIDSKEPDYDKMLDFMMTRDSFLSAAEAEGRDRIRDVRKDQEGRDESVVAV